MRREGERDPFWSAVSFRVVRMRSSGFTCPPPSQTVRPAFLVLETRSQDSEKHTQTPTSVAWYPTTGVPLGQINDRTSRVKQVDARLYFCLYNLHYFLGMPKFIITYKTTALSTSHRSDIVLNEYVQILSCYRTEVILARTEVVLHLNITMYRRLYNASSWK